MILPAITSGSVKEEDVLVSVARLLVEYFRAAPDWSRHVCVSPNDVIIVTLWFFIGWCWTNQGVVKDLQCSTPDMCP